MEEIREELDKAKSYLVFKDSKAGKNFLSILEEDIETLTQKVCAMFGDATHIQLINELSKLAEKRSLLYQFKNAEERVNILKEELDNLENNQ